VSSSLVYDNGGPLTVTNTATASSEAGTDSNPANNAAEAATDIVAVADLQVLDLLFADAPADLIAGEPTPVTVQALVTNGGPSSPMDTVVTATASASADAAITPTNATFNEAALSLNEQRAVSQVYTLECSSAHKTFNCLPHCASDAEHRPQSGQQRSFGSLELDCVIPSKSTFVGQYTNPINLAQTAWCAWQSSAIPNTTWT
jgi:hypothetical protein